MTNDNILRKFSFIILIMVIIISSCGRNNKSFSIINMTWKIVENLSINLPAGIKIMTGRNDELPINAWVAIIDPSDPDVDQDIIVSEDMSLIHI